MTTSNKSAVEKKYPRKRVKVTVDTISVNKEIRDLEKSLRRFKYLHSGKAREDMLEELIASLESSSKSLSAAAELAAIRLKAAFSTSPPDTTVFISSTKPYRSCSYDIKFNRPETDEEYSARLAAIKVREAKAREWAKVQKKRLIKQLEEQREKEKEYQRRNAEAVLMTIYNAAGADVIAKFLKDNGVEIIIPNKGDKTTKKKK